MEQLRQAATLLYAVLEDMNKIPVEGLDRQRTFLGCADGIQTAAQVILQYVEKAALEDPTVLQESGTAKDLAKQEATDGR